MTTQAKNRGRLLIPTLAILLGACVAGLIFTAWRLRRNYGEFWLARTLAAGHAVPAPALTNARPIGLLLLGDSRIAEWPSSKLALPNSMNAGVDGLTSAELLLRVPTVLEAWQPRMVVIQVGINDLKVLGVYPEMRARLVGGCVSNILAAADLCQRHGARVVVTAVWPPGPIEWRRRIVWNDSIGAAVMEVNRLLEAQVPNRKGQRFVELLPLPNNSERLESYRDALHLKPESYDALSAKLRQVLAEEPASAGKL